VLAELLELAPGGVEELQIAEGTVEYAVYGAPGELPSVPALHAAAGDALVEVSTSVIADDWGERWKRFHRPVLIEAPRSGNGAARRVPGLRVRPPWEAPGRGAGDAVQEIVIDPGQAFGTGAHATTRVCLELLLALAMAEHPSGPLLDVGTGSGVLAIAACKLGFAPVLALDNDRASVAAARDNAAANGVDVDERHFDLRATPLPVLDSSHTPPDPLGAVVVLANLLRPLLLELAHTMNRQPAHLLAGGLLIDQADEITRVFAERLGLRERARRESGEWAAVWLTAPRSARP
jgi:ribosomal protein L11 methyltransferase